MKYSNENMKPTKITFIYELQAFGYHAASNHNMHILDLHLSHVGGETQKNILAFL